MRLHRDNTEFEWKAPAGPFDLLDESQVLAYSETGGFVLEGAFTPAEIAAVLAVTDTMADAAENDLRAQHDGRHGIARAGEIVFAPHLVVRSPTLAAFARHPVLVSLARELIGGDVRLYWDQLVYKHPGTADEFPWHQDNGYTFVRPQQYLTCWVALSDATEENGCPWIVPGLHRYGTLAHRWTSLGFRCLDAPDEARPLVVPAGSIAVFSSLTPHRTGPNLTDATRKSYILQYAPEGAVMYPRDGEPQPACNPEWQFPVVRDGQAAESSI
ncbi:MAG: phytanoyl-CoA dioxygenase family protein [Pseudomonadales bacterium]|jgi:ectoine hydroxylase-related dioxygenase (phytanoyl-CoA dioxygenase family)